MQPLTDVSVLQGVAYRLIDDKTIEVDVMAPQTINHVFDQLSAQRISVRSMRNKMNRIEQLFMRLTKEGAL